MTVYSKKQKKGSRSRMAYRRMYSYGVGYDTRPRGKGFRLDDKETGAVSLEANLGMLMATHMAMRRRRRHGV